MAGGPKLKARWATTLAPALLREAASAPPKWSGWEWVTITVCTWRGGEADLLQPGLEGAVGAGPRQAGIDDGHTVA